MTKTPGICRNAAGCALAKRGRIVQVELRQPFVCPSCGAPLVAPPVRTMPEPWLIAALAGLVIVVIAGAAFWLLAPQPAKLPVHSAPPPVPVAPKPAPVVQAPPPLPPPVSENGSSGPGGPTTVVIPPQLLPPAATPPPATPKEATQVAPPPPKRREHRVVAAARALPKSPPPPEMKPLDGSHPDYPDAYEDTDTKGAVTVTCIVQTDGSATKCQIVHQEGGAAFAQSVLHWLALDSTRFPPLTRHGHPAALPFTWNINFDP